MDKNIQRLIDIEEIKQLKHKYCAACDDNYNPDKIADMFAEDGIWDGGGLGAANGREGIREFFKGVLGLVEFAIHNVSNPIIEVDGDSATGKWNLWQPMVYREDNETVWYAARYEESYVRTADGWKFKNLKLINLMHAPYKEGFGERRFTDDALRP